MLGCVILGFVGAAIFYSPYVGLNLQTRIACPVCPSVLSFGDPLTKFFRYTLAGGILNAVLFLLLGFIVAAGANDIRRFLSK